MQPAQPVKVFEKIYYVQSTKRSLNPIAICPKIRDKMIEWGDTNKGTSLHYKRVNLSTNDSKDVPKTIEVITEDQEKIILTYLTLDLYNKHVRSRVAEQPNFKSEEELQNFYLNENFWFIDVEVSKVAFIDALFIGIEKIEVGATGV